MIVKCYSGVMWKWSKVLSICIGGPRKAGNIWRYSVFGPSIEPATFGIQNENVIALPRHSMSNLRNVRSTWIVCFFFFRGAVTPTVPGPPRYWGFTISLRLTTFGRTPLDECQPDAETSTWQHTTLTRDTHPCLWRDSNPQSQQASGRKRTP